MAYLGQSLSEDLIGVIWHNTTIVASFISRDIDVIVTSLSGRVYMVISVCVSDRYQPASKNK